MVGMGSTTARRLEGMKLGRKGFESIQDARMKMGYGNRMLLGDGLGKGSSGAPVLNEQGQVVGIAANNE